MEKLQKWFLTEAFARLWKQKNIKRKWKTSPYGIRSSWENNTQLVRKYHRRLVGFLLFNITMNRIMGTTFCLGLQLWFKHLSLATAIKKIYLFFVNRTRWLLIPSKNVEVVCNNQLKRRKTILLLVSLKILKQNLCQLQLPKIYWYANPLSYFRMFCDDSFVKNLSLFLYLKMHCSLWVSCVRSACFCFVRFCLLENLWQVRIVTRCNRRRWKDLIKKWTR